MFILNLGCAADHYSENHYTLKMKFIVMHSFKGNKEIICLH